jgi:hypothetical protein
MSTITTLPSAINASKSVIDTNFSNLNTDKLQSTDLKTVNGNSLVWSGNIVISGGGSTTLDWLTDVTIATPTNWQALIYETASSQWKNQSLAGGGDMLSSTYDPAGIAQQVVGTTATQTISWKTLTAPKFVDNGFIADSNGNEMLAFNSNASAVNYLEIENGSTTNPPHIRAIGDDTNIWLHLVWKGTGLVSVCDATDETKRIRFQPNNSTGVTTTLASSDTASHTITLPNRTGTLADDTDLLSKANLAWSTSQAFSVSQLEVGNTDTTITRVSTGKIAVEGVNVGTEGILQNSQSSAYTLVLTDAGKSIYHPSADTTARIWTIPANSSVAFPIGTAVTFVNDTSAGTLTISITTDTLVLAWSGSTGSRTLTANWIATIIKVTSTRWLISGTSNLT